MKAAIVGAFEEAGAPLAFYYAIALAVPVLHGARLDPSFLEHALFVLVLPPLLVLLWAAGCFLVRRAPPASET